MKKILQLGGGLLQLHSVLQLKDAGYEVHIADKNPNCPGAEKVKHFKALEISDAEQVSSYVSMFSIDAILAINEAGVYPASVASVTNKLNNYITPEVALRATDKGLMRQAWQNAGLPQPEFMVVDDMKMIEKAVKEIGFPCMIKPCLNWGSKGVSSIFNDQDLDFAIRFALQHNRNNRYIIECFIAGVEMTIEGLCRNGKVTILSRSDKVHQKHRNYKVAMQLNYPSSLSQKTLERVDELVIKAATALGLTDCAIHCEIIVDRERISLVELAARPGGGHIFGKIVEAQSGIPMPLALIKIFLKEEFDITPRHQKGASYRFFSPPHGIFMSVSGIEEAQRIKGVIDIGFDMAPGTRVGDIASDADRPGYLVTAADNKNEAIELADKILSSLKFQME
jgi:biotin carboxylase